MGGPPADKDHTYSLKPRALPATWRRRPPPPGVDRVLVYSTAGWEPSMFVVTRVWAVRWGLITGKTYEWKEAWRWTPAPEPPA